MPARLTCKFGPMKGTAFTILDEAIVGRSRSCAVVLPDKWVSSRHARIFRDGDLGHYMIEDLGSANGTQLDGLTISGAERLERLHVINFGGGADFFFQVVEEREVDDRKPERKTHAGGEAIDLPAILAGKPPREEEEGLEHGEENVEDNVIVTMGEQPVDLPAILAAGPKREAKPKGSAPPKYLLTVQKKAGKPEVFTLKEGENVVGRAGNVHIIIANAEISRRHAVITLENGCVWLQDEGSANATFVHGNKITEKVEIKPGNPIRFSKVEATLSLAGDSSTMEHGT